MNATILSSLTQTLVNRISERADEPKGRKKERKEKGKKGRKATTIRQLEAHLAT